VLVIYTGWIGATEQGAAICMFQILSILYRLPSGVSSASINLIGGSLGAGNYAAARVYSLASLSVVIVIVAI
jgi:Na+-driven multidrug efflux pump